MKDAQILLKVKDALSQAGIGGAGRFSGGLVAGALDQSPQDGCLVLTGSILRSLAVAAIVKRTSSQSIANATASFISFSAADYDPFCMWNSSTPDRLTIYTAGIYSFAGQVAWETNTTGFRYVEAEINSSTVNYTLMLPGLSQTHYMISSGLFCFKEGDYIRLRVYQNSGGPLNILVGNGLSLAIARIA